MQIPPSLAPHLHLIRGRPLSADQYQFPSHLPHSQAFLRFHSKTFPKPHQGTEISLPVHLQHRLLCSGENQSQVCNLTWRYFFRSPTSKWLEELPSLFESECSVMLQSKSLGSNQCNPIDPNQEKPFQSIRPRVRVDPSQEIVNIQNLARIVSKKFAELCRSTTSFFPCLIETVFQGVGRGWKSVVAMFHSASP